MMPDTVDFIALSLKVSDGRGGIDSDGIHRLLKQKICISTLINELEHHINHGLHNLAVVVGKISYIVTIISGCLKHIKTNQATYCKMIQCDLLFAVSIFYIIDIHTQNFVRDVQQGIFNISPPPPP